MGRLGVAARPPGTPRLRLIDVGTGSGAIAVALAVLLRRRGAAADVEFLGTDASAAALDLARENAVGHGVADLVTFEEADLLPARDGPATTGRSIDVLVANLPYVASAEVDRLPVAASFEPRDALDGGLDGLAVIARLLGMLPDALAPDGVALLEIGSDQEEGIGRLVADRLPGWRCVVEPDLAGHPRVARIQRPGASLT